MYILETKNTLTLNDLLKIAYHDGNSNADIPTDSEFMEKEFSEWINEKQHLFKKLILDDVNNKLEFGENINGTDM